MNTEVSSFIHNSPDHQKEILEALRSLIFSTVPNVNEQYKWSRPVYVLEKDFCYLKTTKKHVTLGFFEFDKIKTNNHLIEGTGKSMRHIKVSDLKSIVDFNIKDMIEEVLD